MKKIFSALVLSLVILSLPAVSLAAEFYSSNNGSVELYKDKTVKNLYIASSTVNVSGATTGDLVAAGNTLNLSGPVEDSLLVAGSNVNISGAIGKNARIVGNSLNINNNIGGDLLAGGSTLTISPETVINGDLIVGVGSLTLNGAVGGKAKITGGDITINGEIKGNIDVEASKLTLGDNARIGGNLVYHSPEAANISSSAVVSGTTDFEQIQKDSSASSNIAGMFKTFGLIGAIMVLAVLFVFVYVLPKTSQALVEDSLKLFWGNIGWGFLTFAVTPFALILLAITIVGLKLAGMLLLIYFGFLAIASLAAALLIGAQIFRWIDKKNYRADYSTILVGVLALIIMGSVPFPGMLVIWIVVLAVLGQLIRYASLFIKSQR